MPIRYCIIFFLCFIAIFTNIGSNRICYRTCVYAPIYLYYMIFDYTQFDSLGNRRYYLIATSAKDRQDQSVTDLKGGRKATETTLVEQIGVIPMEFVLITGGFLNSTAELELLVFVVYILNSNRRKPRYRQKPMFHSIRALTKTTTD